MKWIQSRTRQSARSLSIWGKSPQTHVWPGEENLKRKLLGEVSFERVPSRLFQTPSVSSLLIFEVGNLSRVVGSATVPVSDWSRRTSGCSCQRPIKLFNTVEASGGCRGLAIELLRSKDYHGCYSCYFPYIFSFVTSQRADWQNVSLLQT